MMQEVCSDADVYFFLCSASSLPRTVSFPIPLVNRQSHGPPQSAVCFPFLSNSSLAIPRTVLSLTLLISVTGPHFTHPPEPSFARVRPQPEMPQLRNQTSWHSTFRSMLKTEMYKELDTKERQWMSLHSIKWISCPEKQLRTVTFSGMEHTRAVRCCFFEGIWQFHLKSKI